MSSLDLHFQCGETSLSVRRFSVHEAVSTPYTVTVWARSESPTVDLGAIVGQPAGLQTASGYVNVAGGGSRVWSGVCNFIEQTHAERRGNKVQSTYQLRIVPQLWVLSQRRNNRIFQHLSIPDVVDEILNEWGVEHTWRIDRGKYPRHEYKVQYAESDLGFISRLLEAAGIAYTFPDAGDQSPVLTFDDALPHGTPRAGAPVPYEQNPTQAAERELISRVHLTRDVRPGALTLRDYDFRKPSYNLLGEAPKAAAPEVRYEQYQYTPGGFFVEAGKGGDTPAADDKAVARHDQPAGTARATRELEALRADRAGVGFESNLHDLFPGLIFSVGHHPHPDLQRPLLITDVVLEGTAEGEWVVLGHALFADVPFRPPLVTPRPQVLGVQTVTVVAPPDGNLLNQEIHTDEFGRVRVQFPWDREGKSDSDSSCWIRVNEGWGGAGYGWLNLPRVGHEVLVTFLEGDPDRPIVSGRLFNTTHPVPYRLPDHKTVSTWKSDSSPTSNGFNEIKLEDLKGEELVDLQAEKNERKLVKNDEFHTVGRDRNKEVTANELEVVGNDRMQWTQDERHEMTGSESRTQIKGDKRQLIRGDEVEITQMWRRLLVGKDQDVVVRGVKRETNEWDLSERVLGKRREQVGKDHSTIVYQERHEKVGETFARQAGKEIHIAAGDAAIGEAPDVTIKGPGGFIRIDAMGVTISGTKVDINVGGSAGSGKGSHPKEIVAAAVAMGKQGVNFAPKVIAGHATVAAIAAAHDALLTAKPSDDLRMLDLLKIAGTTDVSTPHNGTVFWSGGKDVAGVAAELFAKAKTAARQPSARLEMTEGGSQLGAAVIAGKDEWPVQSPAWIAVSKRFAQQASGDVHMIVSYMPLSETAIFREEVKMLAANKKVTSVTVWLMTKDANGDHVMAADGTHVLQKVQLKDVLMKPTKPTKS